MQDSFRLVANAECMCLGRRHCDLTLGKMMIVKVAVEHLCRSLPSLWNQTAVMQTTTSRRERDRRRGNNTSCVTSIATTAQCFNIDHSCCVHYADISCRFSFNQSVFYFDYRSHMGRPLGIADPKFFRPFWRLHFVTGSWNSLYLLNEPGTEFAVDILQVIQK